ncbi:MAG TPA: tRNA lysidine(34) synthetase TilS [Candidatus Sulfotelmatobacter sp.]|nr:tRNA lysidine(34) synthetase TilS [Candidatus Sulfotelmatobacter sp.]
MALLRLLLDLRRELGIVLSVVHFNHKLRRAESDADEQFVAGLARQFDLEFFCDSDDVAGHARDEGVSLETAARELRYGFFRSLIEDGPQGLKPPSSAAVSGTAEAVPFPEVPAPNVPFLDHSMPTLSQTAREGWGNLDAPTHAPERDGNLEGRRLNKIVTGHTLDDQAETLLMRIVRGAGFRGLGGIHPRIAVEGDEGEVYGEIVRPLLEFRRRELESYLREVGQSWREDATNADSRFTRNRIRKLVLPLLEKEFNPSVAENLAELAEIARGEEDYWENEITGWMGTAIHWSEPEWARPATGGLVQIGHVSNTPTLSANGALRMGHPTTGTGRPGVETESEKSLQARIDEAPWLVMNASVDRLWFLGEPTAVQRRAVKAIGEHAGLALEFKHIDEILRFAAEEGASGKELSLPLGWKVTRQADQLLFLTPDLRGQTTDNYEFELTIPGRLSIPEIGLVIEVRRVPAGSEAAYNPEHLLDADSLPGPLRVRNWRAGDRFWPDHTKSPKKVKELLQEHHVAHPERRLWPVIVGGDEIVWLRGFAPPTRLRAKLGRETVAILVTKPGSDDEA